MRTVEIDQYLAEWGLDDAGCAQLLEGERRLRVLYAPYLLFARHRCWSCQMSIRVCALAGRGSIPQLPPDSMMQNGTLALPRDDAGMMDARFILELPVTVMFAGDCDPSIWIRHKPGLDAEPMLAALGLWSMGWRHSDQADASYWANLCPYCDALQGDFHLRSGVPFDPSVDTHRVKIAFGHAPLFAFTGALCLAPEP